MCPISGDGNRLDRREEECGSGGRQNNRQLTFNDTIYFRESSSTSLSKNNFNAFSLFSFFSSVSCWVLFTEITQHNGNTTTCPSLRECRQMNNFMIRRINPNCISSSIFNNSHPCLRLQLVGRGEKVSADNVTRCEVNGLIHHQNWLNVFTLCCSGITKGGASPPPQLSLELKLKRIHEAEKREHGIIRAKPIFKMRSESEHEWGMLWILTQHIIHNQVKLAGSAAGRMLLTPAYIVP